jgi:hypothetical protein
MKNLKNTLIRAFLILFLIGTVFWVLLIVSTTIFPADNPIKPFILGIFNLPSDFVGKPYTGGGTPFDDWMFGNWFYNFTSFSTVIVVTGLFTLTRGRNLLEKLLLLQAYALPRERDYWGKVTDRKTHKPVPFSIIRVLSLDKDGKESFIAQSIADLDGRYRLYLSSSEFQFLLEVKSPGYKVFKEEIRTTLIEGANVVKVNIVLDKEDDETLINPVRQFFVKNRSAVLSLLIAYIFFLSTVTFLHAVYSLVFHPNFMSVGDFIFYGFAFPWNVFVVLQRRRFNPGKILNNKTKQVVPNVSFQLFLPNKKMLSILSDENGIIKFDVDPGSYDAKVFKPGYVIRDGNQTIEVDINNEGYLRDNIYLVPLTESVSLPLDSGTLQNPFGN